MDHMFPKPLTYWLAGPGTLLEPNCFDQLTHANIGKSIESTRIFLGLPCRQVSVETRSDHFPLQIMLPCEFSGL